MSNVISRAFDAMPDATLIFDERGRVVAANPAAESALSLDRRALLGATIHDIVARPLFEHVDGALRRALKSGETHESVVKLETGAGARHWDVQVVPVAGQGSRPHAVLAVARDVTDAKRREEEIRALGSKLAELGDSLWHDLRSPLTTIRCFLGFLDTDLKHRDEARLATDIASIRNAVDRMTELLDEVLKRSRTSRRPEP